MAACMVDLIVGVGTGGVRGLSVEAEKRGIEPSKREKWDAV